jgi:ATP-dependent Lhr-like helicase
MRDVLLGTDPEHAQMSRRATAALAEIRQHRSNHVVEHGTVLHRESDREVRWWTWAGAAANRTLHASLGDLVDPAQRIGDESVRLRQGTDLHDAARHLSNIGPEVLAAPSIDERALAGLKFSSALPGELARSTVAERVGDIDTAVVVLGEPRTLFTT